MLLAFPRWLGGRDVGTCEDPVAPPYPLQPPVIQGQILRDRLYPTDVGQYPDFLPKE